MEKDIFMEALHKSQANAPIIMGQVNFDETAEVLEKGKKAAIGEIRTWKDLRVQKTANGWKPVKFFKKVELEEQSVEAIESGNITGPELDMMEDGTEIQFGRNGSYFRKESEGWVFGNSILGSEHRVTASSIASTFEHWRESGVISKEIEKVLVPKKGVSMSDVKVGDTITISGFGSCDVIGTSADSLKLKRDADGMEFTLSKEMFDKFGIKPKTSEDFAPKQKEPTYNAEYNGKKLTDKGLAKLMFDNVKYDSSDAQSRVDRQIDWALENVSNLNEVNLSNALESLWYDHIGISSESLWKYIDNRVHSLAEDGKIIPW